MVRVRAACDVPNEQFRLARDVLLEDDSASYLCGRGDFVAVNGNAWRERCVRFLQEFAGGIVRAPMGESTVEAGRRSGARAIAVAAGALAARARAQEKPMAAELGEFSRWLTWAGRAMRSWRGVVVAGGPARVAACRDVREGRKAVMRLVRAAGSARATQAAQAVRLVRACM